MTAVPEQTVHSRVKRQETLRLMPRSESPNLSFVLPGRLVREFGPIIRVLTCVVYRFKHHFADGRWVTTQHVGGESVRRIASTLQCLSKEALGGAGTTSSLYEDVDQITILIDGSPKIMDLPADGDENFVDMPSVADLAFSALEASAETAAELQRPAANPLVRYPNTPLGKEVFDISEAKGKTMIEPHSPSNDVGRKAVTSVVAGIIHADIVEKCRQVDKTVMSPVTAVPIVPRVSSTTAAVRTSAKLRAVSRGPLR